MFFTMTPEMAKKFAELRKKKNNLPEKPTMTFTQYYNKRFLEEAKFFIENPKFSMKYMMVMAHLQKTIKEKSIKEYKEKYPGYPIDDNEKVIENEHVIENEQVIENELVIENEQVIENHKMTNDKSSQTDTESIINDYDMIDDTIVVTNNEISSLLVTTDVVKDKKSLRRSRRLQTKRF